MKLLQAVVFWFGCVGTIPANVVSMALVAPTTPVSPGSPVRVSLVGFNSSADEAPFDAPMTIAGTLAIGYRSFPVELATRTSGPASIRAGGFQSRDYVFVLPLNIRGLAYIAANIGAHTTTMRAVMDVRDSANIKAPADSAPAAGPVGAAVASIDRTFWNHFGAHDAIYFIQGSDAPAAKFQLSFKYRLRSFGSDDQDHPLRALQFGYTQRSLWDIDARSSPFYDTSYMPALFFESFTMAPARERRRVTWLGFQAGIQHESNGRSGLESRSLNALFFRQGMMLGSAQGWNLIVSPRFSAYVGGLSDNPNLTDYRGYVEWMVAVGKGKGPKLAYTGRMGRAFDHFYTQVDLTIPIASTLLDFATYFTIQYVSGYGETLRSYDRRADALRAGFSLVRLR